MLYVKKALKMQNKKHYFDSQSLLEKIGKSPKRELLKVILFSPSLFRSVKLRIMIWDLSLMSKSTQTILSKIVRTSSPIGVFCGREKKC